MLAVILNQHLIKKERAGRMQKPRIPPHPTTKQEILFLRRMGFPAQKKMNPKIGDYIWFICRWTDLPVLGQVTSLKIDPANKNFPYERPYAEVDWYNGENPSEPGFWCGSTSVLLKDLYETKQELLDSIKFSTTR